MPALSKAQLRFFQILAHNKKLAKQKGMTSGQAKEYVSKNIGEKSYSNLPERKKSK